jgi:hypothetical protein
MSPQTPTLDVLATRIEGLTDGMNQLNQRFDVFQANFTRNDVYTIRHEELIKEVAAVRTMVNNQTNQLQNFKEESDRMKGAINLLKVVGTVLTIFAAIMGSLWWTRR